MALLKLDKLGARERWGLAVAMAFALVYLTDRLVVNMVAERIRAVEAQMATESKELAYNRGVLRSRGLIAAEYARIGELLASELPDSEAINQIKGEMDDLISASGIVAEDWGNGSSVVSVGYTEYLIEIRKFRSSMENLLTFVHKMWQTPGMMRIKSIHIGPGSEDGVLEGRVVISKLLIPRGI